MGKKTEYICTNCLWHGTPQDMAGEAGHVWCPDCMAEWCPDYPEDGPWQVYKADEWQLDSTDEWGEHEGPY